MQTIIVEDNPDSCEQLTFLLGKYAPEYPIVAIANSDKQAIEAIEKHHARR